MSNPLKIPKDLQDALAPPRTITLEQYAGLIGEECHVFASPEMDFKDVRVLYALRDGRVFDVSLAFPCTQSIDEIHAQAPITQKMIYLGIGKFYGNR